MYSSIEHRELTRLGRLWERSTAYWCARLGTEFDLERSKRLLEQYWEYVTNHNRVV